MDQKKNLYQRMSDITQEITAVAKNLSVGWGKNQYKAVGEADVLAAVKPCEAEHGVYSFPVSRRIIADDVLTSTKQDGSESRQLFVRIETVYRFVNVDAPAEYLDITTYGDGVDSQDKAPGKAMTYADKYALLKAYKIITGDDPDQDASKPLKDKRDRQQATRDRTPAPAPDPAPAADPAPATKQMSKADAIAEIMTICQRYASEGLSAKLFAAIGVSKLDDADGATIVKALKMARKYDKTAQTAAMTQPTRPDAPPMPA